MLHTKDTPLFLQSPSLPKCHAKLSTTNLKETLETNTRLTMKFESWQTHSYVNNNYKSLNNSW